ncbi:MAG TPA: hypothetical protein DD697_03295 [Candidatus Komeilibacteria bacterium]|nr:hypothetical protein [Candidatus Komeilibacteria bacterium]
MLNDLFGKNFKTVFLAIIIVELLSFWAQQFFWLNVAVFAAVVVLALVLSWIKLDYGFYLVLTELFIGSKGYLFYAEVDGFRLSLRIGLFLAVMAVWLIKACRGQHLLFFRGSNRYLFYYLGLGLFVMLAALNGLAHQPFGQVFFDANGWLYFLYLPVFFSVLSRTTAIRNFLAFLFAAAIYLSLKTLLLLVIFAHQFSLPLDVIYRWVRQSGVGEITYVGGNFYRIFFQAHVYVLIALVVSLALILFARKLDLNRSVVKWLRLNAVLGSTAIVASLSRSFWVGLAVAVCLLLSSYIFYLRPRPIDFFKLGLAWLVIATAEVMFLNLITLNFNGNLIQDRLHDPTTEAAGSSRLAQLQPLFRASLSEPLLGAGFGRAVTYISNDPRIRQEFKDGRYSTYAFEWGYLDIWLKIGLLGLLSYLALFVKVVKDGRLIIAGRTENAGLAVGLLVALVAVAATSVFSPYLNHPLGIGYILIVSAVFYRLTENYGTSQNKTSR